MLGTIAKLGEARSEADLPIEMVQLDDGWQQEWGDWLTPHAKRFPNGLAPLTKAVGCFEEPPFVAAAPRATWLT